MTPSYIVCPSAVADPRGGGNPAMPPLLQYGHGIHCDQLILRKISKIGATRCQILRLKCTKFDFRWAPDPAGAGYSASPNPIAVFKGSTSKGMKGKRRGGEGAGLAPQLGSLDPPVSQC